MAIEGFIKHGPHCLAGKYSTIGRCSCGAQDAMNELAALRKAAQQSVHWTLPMCSVCGESVARKSGMCEDCEMLAWQSQ